MIAANKAKREAKLAAKELGENLVVSAESPVTPVNDEAYQAHMDAKIEQHEAAEEKKKVKKEKKTKKTAEPVEVSTLLPDILPETGGAVKEKKVKVKKEKKVIEQSSDDNMLAVFDEL